MQPVGAAFRERPLAGDIAFVSAGGSMAYSGMGRELMPAFPELLAAGVPVRTEALTERLTAVYPAPRPAGQQVTRAAHPPAVRLSETSSTSETGS